MSNNSERVISWRQRTKQRIIECFDSKCGICGYNRCNDALDLHHLDPSIKEFRLSHVLANPKSWDKLVIELRKCVLLCANCHREYHAGLIQIPENIKRFDEKYTDYLELKRKDLKEKLLDFCPICGKEKFISNKTCSNKCAATLRSSINWNSIDLKNLYLIQKKSKLEIAKLIGCSDAAVRKRLIKLNIIDR